MASHPLDGQSLFKGRMSGAIQLAGTREALVLATSQRAVVNTATDLPIRPQILRLYFQLANSPVSELTESRLKVPP